MSTHPRARALLDLWFGDVPLDGPLPQNSPIVKRWFSRDDAFDAELRSAFGDDLERATRGEYVHCQQCCGKRSWVCIPTTSCGKSARSICGTARKPTSLAGGPGDLES